MKFNFSLRQKLFGLSALGALVTLGVGWTGYAGLTQVMTAADTLAVNSRAQRDQMRADMMHDAIRSDALAALRAIKNRDAQAQQKIVSELEEHGKTFRNSLTELGRYTASASVISKLNIVTPKVERYISAGASICQLRSARAEVISRGLQSFEQAFRELEDEMETLGDLIEAETKQAQLRGDEAGRRTRSQIFWIAALAVLLVTGLSLIIVSSIACPMSKMTAAAQAIAAGDVNQQIDHNSNDEIGRLADSFRQMIDYIAGFAATAAAMGEGDLTVRIQPRSERDILSINLNQAISSLQDAIQRIAQNTATLSAASEELSATSSQMSASAEETSAQSSVVSTSTRQVSASVQIAASSAEEMHAATREISRSAGEAAQIACAGVKVAAATNQTITRLGENSAEIGQVIKLINSIAEQTNLLALNATIEAARAGEAGKGFAVVASEVRELARETGKATSEISHRITAIQTSAQAAVAAIGEISGIINQISEIQNTVASAVEQQTATTNEISRNVMAAAQGSVEITDNLSGVAQAVQSASIGAAETQRAAAELSRMAADLRHLLSRFRYEQVQSEFDSASADPHFRISGRPSDEQNKVKSVGASA
jgi:methyl-accepting chemotaxis protein